MREDVLARRMFYGGCALLPWLWLVNVLYFRKQVYGPIPFIDSSGDDDNDRVSSESNHIAGGVPDIANIDDDDDDDSDDDASNRDDVTDEEIKMELRKWVSRSGIGSLIGFTILLAWNISFQVARNSFGPEW
eukprot:CAMPEP_0172490660 /NCGR_PEP_ID=MMETSP1066-20121228/21180_1 /TAXON_ID=671091 /ORGANISM="Coscinodiscus wailesii, Strain CCMP2513" /LENGTH=131 /DNA_ID=CAMNT_0013259253 /DNA_START=167 /DNA_END=559 /DNA_ORIENTATION=-